MNRCGVCGEPGRGSGRTVRIETRRASDNSGRKIKTVGGLCAGCSVNLARVLERPSVQERIFAAIAWELAHQEPAQPTLDEAETIPQLGNGNGDGDAMREAFERWRDYRASG